MLERVCGDVDDPKSFVGKDTRTTYVSLCQGYIGGEKWEKVRRRISGEERERGIPGALSTCNSGFKVRLR